MLACFYNFTVTSTHIYFFLISSHHFSWCKIPVLLRSRICRAVHFFPKLFWVLIPLHCRQQLRLPLCVQHFLGASFGVLQSGSSLAAVEGVCKLLSVLIVISVLLIKLYWFSGVFVFLLLDVHSVLSCCFFFLFLLLFVLNNFFLCSFFSVSTRGTWSQGLWCLFDRCSSKTGGFLGEVGETGWQVTSRLGSGASPGCCSLAMTTLILWQIFWFFKWLLITLFVLYRILVLECN